MSCAQRAFLLLTVSYVLCTTLVDSENERERTLSRRKRYVVFPEGSSFSVSESWRILDDNYCFFIVILFWNQIALCMTVHTLTPDNIFTEGLNWGISYDLPNESKPALEPFLELRKDAVKPNKYDQKLNDVNYQKPLSTGWNYDKKKKYYYPPQYHTSYTGEKYYKPDYNYIRRRHRRELYNKLEIIMNAYVEFFIIIY